MAKGDEKEALNRARMSEYENSQRRESETFNRWVTERPDVKAQADADRAKISDQFDYFFNTGGVDPTSRDRSRGYIDEGLSNLSGLYGGGAFGGGGWSVNPDWFTDRYGESEEVFRRLASNGAISGVDLNAVREPLGRYREFADTGGFTDAQLGDRRARSLAPLSGIYSSEVNDLDRMKNIQGGYAPGYNAARTNLARTSGQQLTDASRATEADIAEAVRSGRMWGIEGIGSTQMNAETLNLAQQEAAQRGIMAGGQGLYGVAGARTALDAQRAQMEASAAASSSAASAQDARMRAELEKYYRGMGVQNEQDLLRLMQSGQMYGTEGNLRLFSTPNAELARYDENLLRAAGLFGEHGLARLNMQSQNKGGGVDWSKVINAAAGAYGAYDQGRDRNNLPELRNSPFTVYNPTSTGRR